MEMNIKVVYSESDGLFFFKPTIKLKISCESSDSNFMLNYLFNTISISFPKKYKYLLIDTPYFYPHNIFYVSNRSHIINKIIYSIDYIEKFCKYYEAIFKKGIPFYYIHSTKETADLFTINIIIKNYINILYIKSEENTIYLTVLADKIDKSTQLHLIHVNIPRIYKTEDIKFNFTVSSINL
jgi:hypothetical protein